MAKRCEAEEIPTDAIGRVLTIRYCRDSEFRYDAPTVRLGYEEDGVDTLVAFLSTDDARDLGKAIRRMVGPFGEDDE